MLVSSGGVRSAAIGTGTADVLELGHDRPTH